MDLGDSTTSAATSPSVPTTPAAVVDQKDFEMSDEIEGLVDAFVKKNKRADVPAQKMAELKAQREKLKAEKKAVQRDLKNEIRKWARLKSKAKKLSAVELVQVLALRAQVAAKQEKQLDEKPAKSSPSKKEES